MKNNSNSLNKNILENPSDYIDFSIDDYEVPQDPSGNPE